MRLMLKHCLCYRYISLRDIYMKTFKMKIVRDKALDWQDDIKQITNNLRERGLIPQGWARDNNYFYIGGIDGQSDGDSNP